MTGVQLIGKGAVLSRFEKFGADSWALYQGKQFIVGGVGVEALDEWLTDFDKAGSTATYILRVYDTDSVPTSSTANADYSACFNFKLADAYEGYGIAGHSSKLMDRIGALEKQLKERDEGDDSNDLNSIIMGWLNDPVKLGHVAGAIRQMIGGGGSGGIVQPAMIAAGPLQAVGATEQSSDAKLARIAAALDSLEKRDPKLIEHLEKLAHLAETEGLLFKAVISKLDAL